MNIIQKVILALYRRGRAYEHTVYVSKLQKRGLKVGKNLKILNDVIIDDSHCWHITIGDDVTLAPRVHILAHDASTKTHTGYTKIGKVVIGDRVFIGASTIVMPGVTIGDDVIIGAGSIVTKNVPSGMVAAGNPVQIIMTTEEFIEKRKKEMIEYPTFDESYTLKNKVSKEMREEMNDKMKDNYGFII